MTFKTYDINVDLVTDASTPCAIRFSQNDRNSAKLLLTITNKGAEIDLSQAKSVRMSFKKADGTRVFQNDCQPINALKGKYQILLKTQTLAAVGNVIAQIHIEEDDRTIDSQKFFFVVNESLASNEAIESTNEFTIIQKAIEAGKKFEGKDIDGIIAAGALAANALPKTGGTMTGNITMKDAAAIGLRWNIDDVQVAGIYGRKNGAKKEVYLYDDIGGKFGFTYSVEDGFLIPIGTNTNLLKKTGGTMEGHLIFPNNKNLSFMNNAGVDKAVIAVDGNDNFFAWNNVNNRYLWLLNGKTGEFTVNADNLIPKAGGDITGTITFTDIFPQVFKKAGRKSWAVHRPEGNSLIFVPELTPNTSTWDWAKQVELTEYGTVKQANDTFWTDIPLQPNVSNIDGRVTQARRQGGTVSINMTYRATSLVNNFVMKLPQVFRPDRTIDTHIIDGAGRAARAIIDPDGTVYCSTVNEDIRAIITYTV
ncbi:BppU family phage baseplate upper protein [Bacillus cereus]|nr:BppU family phage baseplate upper protein [Bacillus cereus]